MACEWAKNLTRICVFQRLCVSKKARGLGIAKKLMEKAIKKAKKLNYEAVVLNTYFRNTPARGVFEKSGFKILLKWSAAKEEHFTLLFKFLMNITGHRICTYFFKLL